MSSFKYKARGADAKLYFGGIEAYDDTEAVQKLSAEGLFTVSIEEKAEKKRYYAFKSKQLSEFCKETAIMLRSGLPVVKALQILAEGESLNPRVRAVYEELRKSVQSGMSLSEAMRAMGRTFPELIINMFASGELSGEMAGVADKMADYYRSDYKLRRKISQATIYPRILALLTVVALVVIFAFVLPSILSLAGDTPLPPLTRFLSGVSDIIVYKWYGVIAFAAAVALIIILARSARVVKYFIHMLFVKFPYVGPLLKIVYTARFARTVSSLYGGGIRLVPAIGVASKVIGNLYIEGQFPALLEKVTHGEPLSKAVSETDGFTKKFENIITIGEETGELDEILDFAAESLEYDADAAISSLLALLEPAALIVMAAIIGSVIVAAILPIYQMYGVIGGV